MKTGLTEQAIVKRLRQALLEQRPVFCELPTAYYLLDAKGGVVDKDVNIERLARQLGVALRRKTLEK
jgi:hypothetical protein